MLLPPRAVKSLMDGLKVKKADILLVFHLIVNFNSFKETLVKPLKAVRVIVMKQYLEKNINNLSHTKELCFVIKPLMCSAQISN